jgi:outer membrane immunogenic protein
MRLLLNRISSALCAALVAMTAQFASAADLSATAPVYAPMNVADWNGVYVGGSLGGRWSHASWSTVAIGTPSGPSDPTSTPISFNNATVRIGGYVGYNWQLATMLVGFEVDAAWGHTSDTFAGIPGTFGPSGLGVDAGAQAFDSSNVKLGWDGSLRGRLGFLIVPTWLIYATAGVAWQQVNINATCNGSLFNTSWCVAPRNETSSTLRTGWTVGGGIETLLWNNWLLRAEYRYADYGSISHTFFAGTGIDEVTTLLSLKTNTALVGLGYKF